MCTCICRRTRAWWQASLLRGAYVTKAFVIVFYQVAFVKAMVTICHARVANATRTTHIHSKFDALLSCFSYICSSIAFESSTTYQLHVFAGTRRERDAQSKSCLFPRACTCYKYMFSNISAATRQTMTFHAKVCARREGDVRLSKYLKLLYE